MGVFSDYKGKYAGFNLFHATWYTLKINSKAEVIYQAMLVW
jgi:hypothetical protein